MTAQIGLFGERGRLQMTDSIRLTVESLSAYGPRHKHWAIAWSGGKDSTALLTAVLYLLMAGAIHAPKTLTVLYADTRMELLPISIAARAIMGEIADAAPSLAASRGCDLMAQTVMAPIDERLLIYILGVGVPPPNNATLRYCTRMLKIDPMAAALRALAVRLGIGEMVPGMGGEVYRGFGEEKLLVLTGVRIGESEARDARIVTSCAGNGAECGQGWYQSTLPTSLCDTLSPLLHWRVCHVWEWLKHWAPSPAYGDWTTEPIAEAYGGDGGEEINARTGCVGCPLAQEDKGLNTVVRQPQWAYLAPLQRLHRIYVGLRAPAGRLRKPGGETRKDGSLVKNQQRLGPLTLDTRRRALAEILALQAEVNLEAARLRRPTIDILNPEEVARIEELIAAGTWPQRWAGDEPTGDFEMDVYHADGTVQPRLFREQGST